MLSSAWAPRPRRCAERPLLSVRDRAWAAEVMLAALTGVEADLVASYAGKPDAWIDGLGATVPTRWKAWLDQHRAQPVWHASSRSFVARAARS